VAVVADTDISTSLAKYTPEDISPLADMLERDYILPRMGHMTIFVNGEKVPLIEFPKAIIARGITGMLSALKGVGEVKSVEIKISNPGMIIKP
jgi:hypothetical protein